MKKTTAAKWLWAPLWEPVMLVHLCSAKVWLSLAWHENWVTDSIKFSWGPFKKDSKRVNDSVNYKPWIRWLKWQVNQCNGRQEHLPTRNFWWEMTKWLNIYSKNPVVVAGTPGWTPHGGGLSRAHDDITCVTPRPHQATLAGSLWQSQRVAGRAKITLQASRPSQRSGNCRGRQSLPRAAGDGSHYNIEGGNAPCSKYWGSWSPSCPIYPAPLCGSHRSSLAAEHLKYFKYL